MALTRFNTANSFSALHEEASPHDPYGKFWDAAGLASHLVICTYINVSIYSSSNSLTRLFTYPFMHLSIYPCLRLLI